MDIESIMLSKISQIKTNSVYYHFYVESKNKTNEYIQQNRNRLTDIENKLVETSGNREEGEGKIGVWD